MDYNHAMFFNRVSHHPSSTTTTTTLRPKSAATNRFPPRFPQPQRRPGSALPGTTTATTIRGGMSHFSYRRVGTAPEGLCRHNGSVSSYGESILDGYYGASASANTSVIERGCSRQLGRVRVYRTRSTVLPDEDCPVGGAGVAAGAAATR